MSRNSAPARESSRSVPDRVVGLFPELLGVGGVQEAGRQTAAALDDFTRRRGWSLDLLSLNDEPGPHLLRVEQTEIPIIGFGRAKLRFVLSSLRHAGEGTRIVLAAHPYLALPANLTNLRSPSAKTIVMSHGIEVWETLPPLRRRALRRADYVLAPSSYTAAKLAEVQSVAREKIRKLPWPMNAQLLRLADANPNADLLLPTIFPKGRVVLTVGRWAASERYKGADDLIEAIALLRASIPELHLVAVGGGDDLPRLRQLAATRGVTDCVSFLEGLSREQLAACYSRCEIFALPSTGEGFGFVFLEAMAFAKPVIGAESGGVPDLIENNVNGLLIPPRNQEQLAKALRTLLNDAPMRARLGAQGAEIVRSRYSFAAFEKKLEDILDNALAD